MGSSYCLKDGWSYENLAATDWVRTKVFFSFFFRFAFHPFSIFLSFSDHLKWWFSFFFILRLCEIMIFFFFILWSCEIIIFVCVSFSDCVKLWLSFFFILWSCEIVIFIFFNIRSCVILIVMFFAVCHHVTVTLSSSFSKPFRFCFRHFSFLFILFVLTIPWPLNCLQELPKGAFSQSLFIFLVIFSFLLLSRPLPWKCSLKIAQRSLFLKHLRFFFVFFFVFHLMDKATKKNEKKNEKNMKKKNKKKNEKKWRHFTRGFCIFSYGQIYWRNFA